ncbi:hypothetical protein [Empedobacter brevis]|uniref:hypothetical protein n=1 Tax=Empedobacter brevis TaxID=247 RepID=UPI002FE03491
MKKFIISSAIFLGNLAAFGQTADTIHLAEINIQPFEKNKMFIENKGRLSQVKVHSASSIATSVLLKKDILLRGIEFYFGSTDTQLCDEFVSRLFIFDENFVPIIPDNDIYYTIDASLGQKKIFNLEQYNLKLEKNKRYYIGLRFEPSKHCKQFIFQAVNHKNMKTIIDTYIRTSNPQNTYNDVGIRYKLYYK